MAELGPKVKEKRAAKWEAAIAPDLLDGEVVWAYVAATRMKPVTSAAVITNARVIGLFDAGQSTDKRIALEARADEIVGVEFPSKMGTVSFRVSLTSGEEVNFGTIDKAEVDFARHYLTQLQTAGIAPQVADHLARRAMADDQQLQARGSVRVLGSPLKDKWWESITRHAHPGEVPWFVINCDSDGRLVAFSDRLLISKTGGLTGFMAGATGGGRETIFPYSDITNIEYNGGFLLGVLEVLTPSYQGTANHDRWRSGTNSNSNPRELSNCLPISKQLYRDAQPLLNELQRKIAEHKRPQVVVHHAEPPATTSPAAGGLASELKDLAEMHQNGLLDDEEFKAAKKAAIAKLG